MIQIGNIIKVNTKKKIQVFNWYFGTEKNPACDQKVSGEL